MTSAFARRAAAALTALVWLVGSTAPAASDDATPTTDVMTVMGGGGYLGHGYMTLAATADDVDVVVADPAADRLEVTAGISESEQASLVLGAPTGGRLAVGRYPVSDYGTDGTAGFFLGVLGRGCGGFEGTLDVLDVSRDATGVLAGLAVDYDVSCGHEEEPVWGSLRWNSTAPYRYTEVVPFQRSHWASGREWGTVTLTNAGTVPQEYGPTTFPEIVGPAVPDRLVVVERDGCAGVALVPGESCTVDLSALSGEDWMVFGWTRTPDGTARGAAYSLLLVPEPGLPGATTLVARPQRGAIELRTPAWFPRYRVLRAAGDGPEVEVARGVDMPWTDADVTVGTTYRYRVAPVSGDVEAPASNTVTTGPLPVPEGAEGTFVPVPPARVVDTRLGTGAPQAALGPGRTLRLDPAEGGHIPSSGVSAVVLNVTGVDPTHQTHLRVWPAGDPRPRTSSVNLAPGRSRPNHVVVPLGEDGEVELYNDAGSAHVVVDVQGYYSTADGHHGGGYHVIDPMRLLDTRVHGTTLGPGDELWVHTGAVEPTCCRSVAVDVNLTVTEATGAGHLTAWDGTGEAPLVSNLNFEPGQTVANHAVVPVSRGEDAAARIRLRNGSSGSVHVVVDAQGWYDATGDADALRFAPVLTSRLVDTRTQPGRGPVARGETMTVPGTTLPPALAHVLNVTATGSPGPGHLTTWSGDGSLPATSSVNFGPGEDAAGLATVGVGADGRVAVTPGTSGVHLVVDHLGYFY